MDKDAGGALEAEGVREQDKYLPIANISRMMKEVLPQNAKIAKDAKELVQQCVSDFIIYITSEASGKCQREKRKTVNGDDILWAMTSLGFDDAIEVLRTYLQKIREAEGAEKTSKGPAASEPPARPLQPVQPPPAVGQRPDVPQPPGYTVTYAPMHMPMQLMPGQQPMQAMQPDGMHVHPGAGHAPGHHMAAPLVMYMPTPAGSAGMPLTAVASGAPQAGGSAPQLALQSMPGAPAPLPSTQ